MINYGDLMHRIVLKSNSDEEASSLIEEIFSLDKKEFFIFLKSIATLLVSQQKEIKELERKLIEISGGSTDISH
jgi:hypothetical protein